MHDSVPAAGRISNSFRFAAVRISYNESPGGDRADKLHKKAYPSNRRRGLYNLSTPFIRCLHIPNGAFIFLKVPKSALRIIFHPLHFILHSTELSHIFIEFRIAVLAALLHLMLKHTGKFSDGCDPVLPWKILRKPYRRLP